MSFEGWGVGGCSDVDDSHRVAFCFIYRMYRRETSSLRPGLETASCGITLKPEKHYTREGSLEQDTKLQHSLSTFHLMWSARIITTRTARYRFGDVTQG